MNWWRRLVHRGEMERHLDAELRFHFDGLVADNLRAGMSEPEARRSARLQFGGVEQMKEECRDARGTRWAEETFRDIGFAVRSLRKSPIFAVTAILILALGIGGNTAMFTLIRTVLLKPLEYADPDGLVRVSIDDQAQDLQDVGFSWFQYEAIKNAKSFSGLGTFFIATENMTLSAGGEPEALKGARISANLLATLGVQPILGRGFRAEEDVTGGPAVAMISASLWRRRFGGDPNVTGRPMTLNATPCNIAGVLPDGFQFPVPGIDVWVPRPWEFSAIPPALQPRTTVLVGVARLKPHVSAQQARNELTVLHRQYMTAHPELGDARPTSSVRIAPLKEQLVANVRPMLWILLGAVGFILLIACANLAGLLLARATVRSREFAIRAAMGASRSRLIRHLLAESLVLGAIGGGLGLLLAKWGLDAITRATFVNLPRSTEIRLDTVVLGFSTVLSLVTILLFGVIPSLQISRSVLADELRKSGAGAAGGASAPERALPVNVRSLLAAGQIALSLVLLIGATLLIGSFARLREVDLGLQPSHLLTMQIALPPARYDGPKQRAFFVELLHRVEVIPGVRSAMLARTVPMTARYSTDVAVVEQPAAKRGDRPSAQFQTITPGYLRTMGIPLRRGRDFTEHDNQNAPPVVIINESFARHFWPIYPAGQDPIGQHILFGAGNDPREIIGIAADIRQRLDANLWPEVDLPLAQAPLQAAALAIRTESDPKGLLSAIRKQVLSLDRDQTVSGVKTMDELIESTLGQRRLTMILLGSFAGLALVLAVCGIYGITAYSVARRTPEFGIRSALGATQRDILRLVLRQGLAIVLAGSAIGIGAALALTRVMKSLLYQVSATDPIIFTAVPALFGLVALLACYIPARRATRINPLEALRWE